MTRRARGVVVLLFLVAALAGCAQEGEGVAWSFERMIRQSSFKAFEESPFFADSMAMRLPPEGTVSRSALVAPAAVLTGREGGATAVLKPTDTATAGFSRTLAPFVPDIPVRLTLDDLRMGQDRFRIFCSPCHGIDGNGGTPVGRAMSLRSPPSLHSDRLREAPAGRIYAVVSEGYGFMPSYAEQLTVAERWAVVGYVRALQLSRRASLPELPDRLRRAFQRAVPGGPPAGDTAAPRSPTPEGP